LKLSVVIPCFNDGHFLNEAIESVLSYTEQPIEIIVVNDGSTDEYTLTTLERLKKKSIRVLSHANQGLAYTRNRGISEANGKYILPLDADNKIKADYIKKALLLLDSGSCDIVYAKPFFFGEDIPERKFETHKFDGFGLLRYNYIDACAIYRKSVWEKTGGYDEEMPFQGNEDWDFWLNSFIAGFKFEFIDDELFGYRISAISMIANVSKEKTENNANYILLKHKDYILNQLGEGLCYKAFYENDQRSYLRTILKYATLLFKKLIFSNK